MNKLKHLTVSVILVLSFSLVGPILQVSASPHVLHAPTLGAADSFSILAATMISDANPSRTTISGDVGSTGGGAAIGVPCTSMLGGSIFSVDAAPIDTCVVNNSTVPGNAQAANTAAFGDLIASDNSTCTTILPELGGQTLVAGVYCSGGVFTLSGTLTLSGTGTWIFQSASTLITSGTANVVGGGSCDVWWRVPSSATLGSGTQLTGNILALTDITIASGATLNGRAFAQTGQVTLSGNTIARGPLCAAAAPTTTPTTTATPTSTTTTVGAPTSTPTTVGAPTSTPTTVGATGSGPTATSLAGIAGLPNTGGGPIRNEKIPWIPVIVFVISGIFLVLAVRAYRRTRFPRQ